MERLRMRVSRAAQQHLRNLTDHGFDVFSPEDFRSVPKMVAETGRPAQTPMLSIDRNDFVRSDAFWLFLMRDGVAVGGCAARRYDLAGESLESYLRRTSKNQYMREEDPIISVAKPLRRITGRLIYLGELQLHKSVRGNVSVLSSFFHMAQALAALEWEFDWIYAFVPLAHRRLVADYGFNFYIKNAITWHDPPPPGRLNDHVLVAIDIESFSHLW